MHTEGGQSPLLNFFFPAPLGALLGCQAPTLGKMAESGRNTLKLEKVFVGWSQFLLQTFQIVIEDSGILAGVDWKTVVMVENTEFTVVDIKHHSCSRRPGAK